MTLGEFGLQSEVVAQLQRSGWRLDPAKAASGIAALRKKRFDVFPAAETALSLLWGARFEVGKERVAGVEWPRMQFVIDPLGAIEEFSDEGVAWMRAIADYLHQPFIPLGQDLQGHAPGKLTTGNQLLMALGNAEVIRLAYGGGFLRVGSPISAAINRLALGLRPASSFIDLPPEHEPF